MSFEKISSKKAPAFKLCMYEKPSHREVQAKLFQDINLLIESEKLLRLSYIEYKINSSVKQDRALANKFSQYFPDT